MLRRTDLHLNRLVVAVIAACAFGLSATLALAKVAFNTIDPIASVSDGGRHLVVTGPITCTPGERLYLRVTVTLRTTGALAEGATLVECTGIAQEWEAHTTNQGREVFTTGPATAVAVARTTERGDTTDAHQWLVAITLVDE